MNIVDILGLVGKSEDAGDIAVSLRVHRRCLGFKTQIVPGLLADVVQWGGKVHPSVVLLRNVAVRAWASRSKHAMLRTWAAAKEPVARDQALKLVTNTFGEKR